MVKTEAEILADTRRAVTRFLNQADEFSLRTRIATRQLSDFTVALRTALRSV